MMNQFFHNVDGNASVVDVIRYVRSDCQRLLLVFVPSSRGDASRELEEKTFGANVEEESVLFGMGRVKLSNMGDIAWFRKTFGIQNMPTYALIGADGHVLYHGDRVVSRKELEEIAKKALDELWVRLLLSYSIVKAVYRLENNLAIVRRGKFYSAAEWTKKKAKRKKSMKPDKIALFKRPTPTPMFNVAIRLLNGERLVHRFNKRESTVRDVISFIDENRTDGNEPYKLAISYPTHEFTEDEFEKVLQDVNVDKHNVLMLIPLEPHSLLKTSNLPTSDESILTMLKIYLATILAWFFPMSQRRQQQQQPQTQTQMQAESRGGVRSLFDEANTHGGDDDKNEYFGGDSTVFQGK